MKKPFISAYERSQTPRTRPSKQYPVSRVVLDPTCTLEQILNRAQYGMAIPQRDVTGELTGEELSILGIDGNAMATMTRMEIIDLRMKAQMRMNALAARKAKKEQKEREEALKKGAIDDYIASKREQSTE